MVPRYAQQVYAVLLNKFGENEFSSWQLRFLDVFMSKVMKKKVLFLLSKKKWIKRIDRGKYKCINPKKIFKEFFKPKMLNLLKFSGMIWCFSALNALEVYSDFTVAHRGWLSSPFYIKVLKKDLRKWIRLFKKNDVPIFINIGKPQFGEYVILIPKKHFDFRIVKGYPVEPLEEVIEFTKKRSYEFAFELEYLKGKYGRRI